MWYVVKENILKSSWFDLYQTNAYRKKQLLEVTNDAQLSKLSRQAKDASASWKTAKLRFENGGGDKRWVDRSSYLFQNWDASGHFECHIAPDKALYFTPKGRVFLLLHENVCCDTH